jgi:putative transposase
VENVPRPLRPQFADGLYHVTTHSNLGRLAFENDTERWQFLEVLEGTVTRHGWSCQSYCLLSTHYHALVLTPEPDIAAGMQYLNGCFAQKANWRRTERGHVFEGRYKSVLVQTESHLLEVHRYIAMNPVRAGLVQEPAAWPWSSVRAMLGRERPLDFLDLDAALDVFGPTRSHARRRFRVFLQDGLKMDAA